MQHCCRFKPDDIYYLEDTDFFSSRILSIGFCPICKKPVAQLVEWRFDGECFKQNLAGIKANELVLKNQDKIVYSMKSLNYKKLKSKPFGWKYGINKLAKKDNKEFVKQYACDFYGNKELIKNTY